MQKIALEIRQSPLFDGVETEELSAMLTCLGADIRKFAKKSFIFRAGDRVSGVGLVLRGRVHSISEDFLGNRNILSVAGPGELFGEICACTQAGIAKAGFIAVEESEALFLDTQKIMTVCSSACAFHTRVIRNLLRIMAEQTMGLSQKIEFVTQRTTRAKLLAYLSVQAGLAGSSSFSIPFNRQQMAEYLSVDRSAMSNELSKLRAEGVLAFEKNSFTLYRQQG